MMDSQKYEKWEKDREIFRWIVTAAILLYGLEDQVVVVSLLYYLMDKYNLPRHNVSFYFSMTQLFFSCVQMIAGVGLGRYADRTRNLRKVVLLNLTLTTVLNLTYTLPFPLWVIIIARSLMGVTESLQTAVLGE